MIYWIAFGADPSDDKESYKRYVGTHDNPPSRIPGEDIVWVITLDEYDRLQEDLKRLHADYMDRGAAMRETGAMVRSLYAPKNERLNKNNGKLTAQLKQLADAVLEYEAACKRHQEGADISMLPWDTMLSYARKARNGP